MSLPYAVLTLAMVLLASSFIAIKYVFQFFNPYFVLFARMALAVCCLLPILRLARVPLTVRRADMPTFLLLGLCQPCLYFVCEAQALTLTSASQAAVISSLIPVFVTLGARLFLGERQGLTAWGGLTVSTLGAALLTLSASRGADAPNPVLGNVLELLAALCAVGYILLLKRVAERYAPLTILFQQTLIGVGWFSVALATPWGQWPRSVPIGALAVLIYLGVGVTLLAFACYTWAIRSLPVTHAAMFSNLVPVFSLAFAMTWLGERLSAWQWLACAAILGGVMLGSVRGEVKGSIKQIA